ncbi:MAG: hypothetical protein ACI81A_002356 [Paraglaciecola sp.]|jgi:hypothetical protein
MLVILILLVEIKMNKLEKNEDSAVSKVPHSKEAQSTRRKILVRASVGVAIVSIPGRTAWASGGSVAASGAGSGAP